MPDLKVNTNYYYLSYSYVVNQLKQIQEKHGGLNSFICGPIEELDIEKLNSESWPVLYLEPNQIEVDNYTQTFSFEIAVLDKYYMNESYGIREIKKEGEEDGSLLYTDFFSRLSDMRRTTLNDCYMIAKDVIASFIQNNQSISWINTQVDLELPINLSPISTGYDASLSGWTGTIRITANNKNDLCKAMIRSQE
tara:strand:+ start:845 stop:1426 length:582 start_codon:yes stop_codon:yes gene_type:complete